MNILYTEYIKARPQDPERAYGSRGADAMMAALAARSRLSEPVRNRLLIAFSDGVPSLHRGVYSENGPATDDGFRAMVGVVAARLARAWGQTVLLASEQRAWGELVEVIRTGRDPEIMDVIGSWLDAYARIPGQQWMLVDESKFSALVDDILAGTEYARRGRDLVLRRDAGSSPIIEEPLRVFVTANPKFARVDAKLAEAFAELNAGKGADAITDAATALQLLLTELGHAGPTLGAQLKRGRKHGLFAGIDQPLADSLEALALWVASVRNQRGDAHPGAEPDHADAELLVRMVALLLMRLGR